jgi:hypothetical protein
LRQDLTVQPGQGQGPLAKATPGIQYRLKPCEADSLEAVQVDSERGREHPTGKGLIVAVEQIGQVAEGGLHGVG